MKILKTIGAVVAKLPNTKIGKKIGQAVSTKGGGVADQVLTGGIFSAIFKEEEGQPVGTASPKAWARAIIQIAIVAYLIYSGDIQEAIEFFEGI